MVPRRSIRTPGSGLDERAVPSFVGLGKQAGNRDVERLGQSVQRPERWRDAAILDLREHPGRNPGGRPEFGDCQVDRFAQSPHLEADAGLERPRRKFAWRCRTGPKVGVRVRLMPLPHGLRGLARRRTTLLSRCHLLALAVASLECRRISVPIKDHGTGHKQSPRQPTSIYFVFL